jgi:hypothetical protein
MRIASLVLLLASQAWAGDVPRRLFPQDDASWKQLEAVARQRAAANRAEKLQPPVRLVTKPGDQTVSTVVHLEAGRCQVFMFAWSFAEPAAIISQLKPDKQGRTASPQVRQEQKYEGKNGGILLCADRAGDATLSAHYDAPRGWHDQFGFAMVAGSYAEPAEQSTQRRARETSVERERRADTAAWQAQQKAQHVAMIRADCRACFARFNTCDRAGGGARCENGLKHCVGQAGLNNGITEQQALDLCTIRVGGR